MSQPSFVVGAYASLPKTAKEQENYYQLLGRQSWIDGTELPYPGNLADRQDLLWLASVLPQHWHHNTITAIPGTMKNVWADATFGLASPDADGRRSALDFCKKIRDAVAFMADVRDSLDISHVEIHSAPTKIANVDAMRRSLEELLQLDWCGAHLVIEHCDRYKDDQKPEKGFLTIEDEIALAKEFGIGVTVNWGRSVLEDRSAKTAVRHIRLARRAGVLSGVMFSGAGPEETQYGYSWIDGHLPMNPDEPTSLMNATAIGESTLEALKAGVNTLAYLGAKICVPADATLEERLGYLAHIHNAVVSAQEAQSVTE